MAESKNTIIATGKINRNHLSNGTRHILNMAINPPRVGFIRLEIPSPI
jgi:hypothetical protein